MPPTPPRAKIAIVARQAGSASAFEPVVERLTQSGQPPLIITLGDACAFWRQAPFESHEVEDFSHARALLEVHPVEALLTGTSSSVVDDEAFWRWAIERDLHVTAHIDSWCNYGSRFRLPSGDLVKSWPSVIGVIDELAKRGAIADGLPPERIKVTGNPGFDRLTRYIEPPPELKGGLKVLFASQPLVGRDLPAAWDEHYALETLLDATKRAHVTDVNIRLHPAEASDTHAAQLGKKGQTTVAIDAIDDRHATAMQHHIIVGVVSTYLVEAQWLGRHVASIQRAPGHSTPIIDGHSIPVFNDAESLSSWFQDVRTTLSRHDKSLNLHAELGGATEALLAHVLRD